MAAVAALPHTHAVAGEHQAALDVLAELQVPGLVLLLNLGNRFELRGDVVKTLFAGDLRKTCVHVGPLVVLAGGGVLEVGHGVGDGPAVQMLVPQLGMLFLIFSRLEENRRDLLKTVLLGAGSIVGILVSRHRFTGKRRVQIGFGAGTL